jgi:hypothetical protein
MFVLSVKIHTMVTTNMIFMYNTGEQKEISIIHLGYVNDVLNLLNACYERLLQRT